MTLAAHMSGSVRIIEMLAAIWRRWTGAGLEGLESAGPSAS